MKKRGWVTLFSQLWFSWDLFPTSSQSGIPPWFVPPPTYKRWGRFLHPYLHKLLKGLILFPVSQSTSTLLPINLNTSSVALKADTSRYSVPFGIIHFVTCFYLHATTNCFRTDNISICADILPVFIDSQMVVPIPHASFVLPELPTVFRTFVFLFFHSWQKPHLIGIPSLHPYCPWFQIFEN